MKQTTLKSEIRCSGIGLHSGKKVSLLITPAPAHTGIVFSMGANGNQRILKPGPEKVIATGLATTLGDENEHVSTVEHLLAAFLGLEVDNAIVVVDGNEIPIMDGSAAPFVFLINSVGIRQLPESRKVARIKKRIEFTHDGKEIVAMPFEGLKVDYRIKFPHEHIGEQLFSYTSSPRSFAEVIAKCRTFGFLKDVEMLQKNGLALGGSLDNAVVFDDYGVVNPDGLRFRDEMVRHKILDFMGDIGVAHVRLQGHFQVSCSGHDFNNKFVRYIFEHSAEYLEISAASEASVAKTRRPLNVAVGVPAWA